MPTDYSKLLEAQSPVAFHYNGYGDRLLSLPALRALCSLFPGRMKLICAERDRRTFFADLPLADVVEIRCRKTPHGWSFDAESVAESVGACDLFISLNPWHSESVGALLSLFGSAESVGFGPAFGRRVAWDARRHAADRAFEVARQFRPSLKIEDFSRPARLPDSEVEVARFIRNKIPGVMRVLALHTYTVAEKMWPADRFVTTLDEFLERHPDYVAFVLDSVRSRLDSGRHGDRVFPIPCSEIPLARSFAILNEADLFLGIDSCMLHLADLSRIPGVGLFGPTNPEEYGFRFGPHRHVRSGHSMKDLQPGDVIRALEELVEVSEDRVAAKARGHAY